MLTITEALAEIKTLGKRMTKKRETVALYLARQDKYRDPHEKAGGSAKFIAEELQSLADLEARLVSLRVAIQAVNQGTTMSVGGETRTIAAWLNWKREIAPLRGHFLAHLRNALGNVRQEAGKLNVRIRTQGEQAEVPTDVIVNVDEAKLAKWIEDHEQMLGDLDGQLSLKNATTTVDA